MPAILEVCHISQFSVHHRSVRTAAKFLQSRFYYPKLNRYSHKFVRTYRQCQIQRSISRKQQIPLKPNHEVELFDVLGVDFI